ncbi:MAG: twin-arginine translocase TatA/TatE family subunit [Caulobacterales bacterium]
MHMPGLIPLLVVLFLAFLLFGRPGRLSGMMEDLGKGIKGFRKGLSDGDTPPPAPEPPRQVTSDTDRTPNG